MAGRAHAAAPPVTIDLPDVELLDGRVMPRSAWTTAPTVVVFFTTYCGFCKRHNPRIEKLHQSGAVRVLGVVLQADQASAARYVDDHGLHFAVTRDDGALLRRFSTRRAVPLTCLVDRSLRLLMSIPGEMSEDDVMALPQDLKRLGA